MAIYLTDGSFEGLLSAIYAVTYARDEPGGIYPAQDYQTDLMHRPCQIATDPARAARVMAAIEGKLSPTTPEHVLQASLHSDPEAYLWIYRYLALGWRVGRRLDSLLTEEAVHRVQRMSRAVGAERHKLLGLLRFRELKSGAFYAPIRPTHHVLPLMGEHFAARMDRPFLIHDVGRDQGVICNGQEPVLIDLKLETPPEYAAREADFQALWQLFFARVANQGRINPTCQRGFMPKKYWRYLVERPGSAALIRAGGSGPAAPSPKRLPDAEKT